MMAKNPMQLKAFIKNMAAEKNISAQLVMQNYMLERLIERISLSEYRNNFILKGGFLIAAIVGLDTRTTMDLDTTLKDLPLTQEAIEQAFAKICAIEVPDDITFTFLKTTETRKIDDYPGFWVSLSANYSPLKVPLSVDVTTGDKITPREIEYSFPLLFEDRSISMLTYNLETILAEKIETVISRNIANTRPRDLYDVHILHTLRCSKYDPSILRLALEETATKRGSLQAVQNYEQAMESVLNSPEMQRFWLGYQKEFEYAKDIPFDDVCNSVVQVLDIALSEN